MKVVIVCNIIISAGLNQGNCRKVIQTVVRSHECLLSTEITREYAAIPERDKFAAVHDNLVQLIHTRNWNAHFVMPESSVFRLPDEKGQIYLDTALSGEADAIITGNLKHFPESIYMNVRVLPPKALLDLISLP